MSRIKSKRKQKKSTYYSKKIQRGGNDLFTSTKPIIKIKNNKDKWDYRIIHITKNGIEWYSKLKHILGGRRIIRYEDMTQATFIKPSTRPNLIYANPTFSDSVIIETKAGDTFEFTIIDCPVDKCVSNDEFHAFIDELRVQLVDKDIRTIDETRSTNEQDTSRPRSRTPRSRTLRSRTPRSRTPRRKTPRRQTQKSKTLRSRTPRRQTQKSKTLRKRQLPHIPKTKKTSRKRPTRHLKPKKRIRLPQCNTCGNCNIIAKLRVGNDNMRINIININENGIDYKSKKTEESRIEWKDIAPKKGDLLYLNPTEFGGHSNFGEIKIPVVIDNTRTILSIQKCNTPRLCSSKLDIEQLLRCITEYKKLYLNDIIIKNTIAILNKKDELFKKNRSSLSSDEQKLQINIDPYKKKLGRYYVALHNLVRRSAIEHTKNKDYRDKSKKIQRMFYDMIYHLIAVYNMKKKDIIYEKKQETPSDSIDDAIDQAEKELAQEEEAVSNAIDKAETELAQEERQIDEELAKAQEEQELDEAEFEREFAEAEEEDIIMRQRIEQEIPQTSSKKDKTFVESQSYNPFFSQDAQSRQDTPDWIKKHNNPFFSQDAQRRQHTPEWLN